ncbi:MAG: hypothetical protein EOO88_42955 [Pedobacter sp.]|nr:MAG: hypothetical protein EOO88_42955 [Pedobacter sp.]
MVSAIGRQCAHYSPDMVKPCRIGAINCCNCQCFSTREANYIRRGMPNTVVIFAGTNDIVSGANPETIVANTKTITNIARTQGAKVLVTSSIARNFNEAQELTRQNVRELIAADSSWYDGYCDLSSDPLIGIEGTQTNSTYFHNDQTHLTQLGQTVLARLLMQDIENLTRLQVSIYGLQVGTMSNSRKIGIGI